MSTVRKGSLIKGKYNEYLISTIAMSASMYLAAIVDNIMVANILGPEALAAANLITPTVYIKNIIFAIFIYGGNTVAAIYKGRRDNEKADKAFTIAVVFGIIASSLLCLTGMLLNGPISSFLAQNGKLYQLTYDYLFLSWLSGPIVVLNSGIAAFVRTDGLKGIAVALPVVSNVINLGLDYVYMSVLDMGISGASLATFSGYALGSFLLIPYFISKKRTVHFKKVSLRDMKILVEVLKTGLASALIHLCNAVRTGVINGVILAAAGDIGMQVVSVCMSALNLALIFINGSSMTLMPVCGALYGEKDRNGVKFAVKHSLVITMIMSSIILIVFMIFPQAIGSLFAIKSAEASAMLETAFRIFSLCIPFYGIAYILRAFYQSTGQNSAASLFTVLDGVAFIVPLIYLFSTINQNLMWLSFTIAEILAIVVTAVIMQIVAKKKGKNNFLMLEKSDEQSVLDMTISNTVENAEEIPRRIMEFCTAAGIDKKTANLLSVSAEELAVNVAKYAYGGKDGTIDICLRKLEDKLVLRFRDNGVIFNPTSFKDESGKEITGLSLVRKITPHISFSRVLSLNVTVITVEL